MRRAVSRGGKADVEPRKIVQAPLPARHGTRPRLASPSRPAFPSVRADPPQGDGASAAPPPTGVQSATVSADEAGMRVDRFLEARFPGLSFSHIQRIIRKGELRVNGKRVKPKDRLLAGQAVRIPPLRLDQPKPRTPERVAQDETRDFLASITLFEDADVLVFNKPMGLAVQG